MRTNLKILRVKVNLTQEEMADKIGVARSTYRSIESGERDGRQKFWDALQAAFSIAPGEMWELMRNE